MKQKFVRGQVNAGDKVKVFICKNCNSAIPVLNPIEQIPEPLKLQCPKCLQSHSYQLAEIRDAVARTKQ
jgi:RNase P subunit RPR2